MPNNNYQFCFPSETVDTLIKNNSTQRKENVGHLDGSAGCGTVD